MFLHETVEDEDEQRVRGIQYRECVCQKESLIRQEEQCREPCQAE